MEGEYARLSASGSLHVVHIGGFGMAKRMIAMAMVFVCLLSMFTAANASVITKMAKETLKKVQLQNEKRVCDEQQGWSCLYPFRLGHPGHWQMVRNKWVCMLVVPGSKDVVLYDQIIKPKMLKK